MRGQVDLAMKVTHELLDKLRPYPTKELLEVIAAASALLRSRRVPMAKLLEAGLAGEAAAAPVDRRKRKDTPSSKDVFPVPKEEK